MPDYAVWVALPAENWWAVHDLDYAADPARPVAIVKDGQVRAVEPAGKLLPHVAYAEEVDATVRPEDQAAAVGLGGAALDRVKPDRTPTGPVHLILGRASDGPATLAARLRRLAAEEGLT